MKRAAGLLAAVLMTFVAFGSVVPVLPLYIVDSRGGSGFDVGLVFAFSAVATLLARPYAGQAAQRFGSRNIMVAGCLLAAVVGLGYTLSPGMIGLLAIRFVMGLAEAMVFTAGAVWIVALAPEDRRAEIVGYYGLSMWSGWTIGPLIGLWLKVPAVWWFAALAPVLAMVVLLLVSPPQPQRGAVSRRLIPPTVLMPGFALALAAFGYAALTGFIALYLGERGIANGAAMLSVFAAAYVIVRIFAGRIPDRVGPRPVVAFCGVAVAAGLVLLTAAPNWWWAALGAVVMGGGFTLLYPALALVVIRRSSPDERGAALGAYTSFWDLGLGAASLAAGVIALAGYVWVFALAIVLALAAAAIGTVAAKSPATAEVTSG